MNGKIPIFCEQLIKENIEKLFSVHMHIMKNGLIAKIVTSKFQETMDAECTLDRKQYYGHKMNWTKKVKLLESLIFFIAANEIEKGGYLLEKTVVEKMQNWEIWPEQLSRQI